MLQDCQFGPPDSSSELHTTCFNHQEDSPFYDPVLGCGFGPWTSGPGTSMYPYGYLHIPRPGRCSFRLGSKRNLQKCFQCPPDCFLWLPKHPNHLNTTSSSPRTAKGMHRPGIEPGAGRHWDPGSVSRPWQRPILPLNHQCCPCLG
jgi:hypothetical protein